MRVRPRRRLLIVALTVLALVATGCADVVDGHPHAGNAANARLPVKGTDGGAFDQKVQNALSDIEAFWRRNFPKVSGGKALTPLQGGLYSVDGLKVAETGRLTGPITQNACARKDTAFVVDNGAFCTLDDSIAWDRAPTHLFAQLADKYGALMVALIFAHEFGHSISYRLGVFKRTGLSVIDTESQADCAAGAWAASALKGEDPHFRNVTPAKLDDALEGFLDGRDSTPDTPEDVSHGNGFDRLSALSDGIDKGVTYCFSPGYFASRTFTERPYTSAQDAADNGNQPFADVVTLSNNGLVQDLNRYWTAAAKTVGKTFRPVTIAEAAHPKCAANTTSRFGYCASDNTVYFDTTFAQSVYDSLPDVTRDRTSGNVTLVSNQAADYALGEMFAVAWGMAVRQQLFGRSQDGKAALLAAICYSGAYAKNINVPAGTPGHNFTLSPSDLDEATSALLDQVGKPQAFGERTSTGLERIQSFVTGYKGGLSSC